jgi:hypothetical protein
MVVKDSIGKVVGSYFLGPYDPFYHENSTSVPGSSPREFVFVRAANQSFAIRFSAVQLGGQVDYNVSFTSSDCSPTIPGWFSIHLEMLIAT